MSSTFEKGTGPDGLLKGKNAVITGCNRGIGRGILECFARNGAGVWACCRKPTEEFEKLAAGLSEECGVRITPVYFDLTDETQIKAGVKSIVGAGGNVDILVNNAGMVSENALFQMTSMEVMKRVFEVNFFSQILLTQYLSRKMVRQKSGVIINIASVAGMDGTPGQLEYVASKAALIGATKKLAFELADAHIRVNALAPGVTETEMVKGMSDETLTKYLGQCKMRRMGRPSEIAQAALFLASEMSSFITGQVFRVDGGI